MAAETANIGSSPKVPAATIPTTKGVVVEELCIRLVARIPINKPIKGAAELERSSSARPIENTWLR